MNIHEKYMRQALDLALNAKGKTLPNPLVGAIIVKDGRTISKGFHRKAGMPHAEIIALKKAGKRAKGATLYINLEPCSHFGRTPPCVNEIIKGGIKEVIIGMSDPNPVNNGRSIQLLKNYGIKVKLGILEKETREINKPFIKYITKSLPFITVKVGQSLDGKIATKTGDSKWITSIISRRYSHCIRSFYDGIMIGVNTLLIDNPLLKPVPKERNLPVRIIIDSNLNIPSDANVFKSKSPTIIATSSRIKTSEKYKKKVKALIDKGARIIFIKERTKGILNLKELLAKLAKLEITNILVEGGGKLIGTLFDQNLVDKVLFFIAAKIIGGENAISSVRGEGISNIEDIFKLSNIIVQNFGEDILVEGEVIK